MSYDPSAGQGQPPGGYNQPGQPGQYGQPAPGYGAPGPYPGAGSPYGTPGYGAPVGPMPSNYRGWAITNIVLGVLFCLIVGLPMGIAANYYAGKVKSSYEMGDLQGAATASSRARLWNILATVFAAVGLIFSIVYIASRGGSTTS